MSFLVSHRFAPLALDQLDRFAVELVSSLPDRVVIGMVGTLGAGKTTLTQAIASAIGLDRESVTSPTFSLLCSYSATVGNRSITLHHIDAYRLGDEDEFLELGVEEFFEQPNTWTLIEWADRVAEVMPDDTLWINIAPMSAGGTDDPPPRSIVCSTNDGRLPTPLAELAKRLS